MRPYRGIRIDMLVRVCYVRVRAFEIGANL